MKIDNVVKLSSGKKYLLLLEDDFFDDNYFLSVLLDENNDPTDEYAVLKEIQKDGKVFTQKVNDPSILSELLEDYRLQYQEDYANED